MSFKAMLTRGLAPIEYLTAALVFAAAVSGWFVVETVIEMQVARRASFRPLLVPHVESEGAPSGGVFYGVKNVGNGPAIAVHVTIALSDTIECGLRRAVMAAGEVRLVTGIQEGGSASVVFEPFRQSHPTLTLIGKYFDLEGSRHDRKVVLPFRDEWRHDPLEAFRRIAKREGVEGVDP